MKIAVYGATGYTGRLVAAELQRRDMQIVLSGRDPQRLREIAGDLSLTGAEFRAATIDHEAGLVSAFRDCDAVVNCAGPFISFGAPVVRAAIAAGCHYVDTSAEQLHVKRTFDTASEDAQRAGITVIPAMGYDIVPGDFIAHVTGQRVEPIDRLVLGNGTARFDMTRGTMRSALMLMRGGDVRYENGAWRPGGGRIRRARMQFPRDAKPTPMVKFAGGEVISIPRHLVVRDVEVSMRSDAVAPRAFAFAVPAMTRIMSLMLRTPLRAGLDRLVGRLPEGPETDARQSAAFSFVAEAVGEDGRKARGTIEGTDIYGITAVIAAEGVRRLVQDGAPAGVRAPAEAFDVEDFLGFLERYGIEWGVDVDARAATAA
jgi:short subunit dehydrogenase-like uncharacterized protein